MCRAGMERNQNESRMETYPVHVGGFFLGGFLPTALDLLAAGAAPSELVEVEVLAAARLRVAPATQLVSKKPGKQRPEEWQQ